MFFHHFGTAEVLAQLAAVAPVTAVRGNNDKGAWAEALPETERFEINGTRIYVIHDLAQLHIEPAAAGVDVVVSGHSHRPRHLAARRSRLRQSW